MNTCGKCLDGLEIPTRGRPDLSNVLIDDEDFEEVNEDIEE
jgi:hypothetical protein